MNMANAKYSADESFEALFQEVRYDDTPSQSEILRHLQSSVAVTTYQAGKLLVLDVHDDQLRVSFVN